MSTLRPVALTSPVSVGDSVVLPADEAHHLARVLRVRPGDGLRLFFGGRQWRGRVEDVVGGQEVRAFVEEDMKAAPGLPVRLWFALPALKGGHTEELMRHLTEAGAAGFVLLEARRAIARHDTGKVDRRLKVLVEAAKQCGRADVPVLFGESERTAKALALERIVTYMASREGHIGDSPHTSPRFRALFICAEHAEDAQPLSVAVSGVMSSAEPPGPDILIATGPEGGWSPEEIEVVSRASGGGAGASAVKLVTLGPLVLRAETAPLVAAGAALAGMGRA